MLEESKRSNLLEDMPLKKRVSGALMLAPACVAIGFASWFGPYLVDDAYITFRYAVNFAGGHGLVFNPGESVLGTTTPLFALILGLAERVGWEAPAAARAICVASFGFCVLLVQVLAVRSLGLIAALGVGLCVACHPAMWFSANSGMETCLSMCAVFGGLLLIQRGAFGWAGAVGGAAFLLRPDGALVALLAIAAALIRKPRHAYRPTLAAGAVAAPWLIYAFRTYGGVTPHSIQAKQLIHPDTPLHILTTNFEHLTHGLGMQIVLVAAAAGLAYSVWKERGMLLVGVWMMLYLAGLSSSRIAANFPWYVTPIHPALALLAASGVAGLVRGFRRGPSEINRTRVEALRLAAPGVFLLIAAMCFRGGLLDLWKPDQPSGPRVAEYLHIGEIIAERSEPGDVVLVGEVGAMAYAMPEQTILDSAGINSPAVYEGRRRDRERSLEAGVSNPMGEGTRSWALELIEKHEPRYVATSIQFVHGRSLVNDPRIIAKYRRVPVDLANGAEYLVLERR